MQDREDPRDVGRQGGDPPICELRALGKRFDNVVALDSVDIILAVGERLGIVGHNGAGKSTLINVLNGSVRPSGGVIIWQGMDVTDGWTAGRARREGVRCIFQELALVPNLTAIENTRLLHSSLRGFGWRRKAAELIDQKLSEIFPGNHIDLGAAIERLPIGQRQMIEVARAFTETEAPVRLVVLDEPTSSLSSQAAELLIAFLRENSHPRPSTVLISHKLRDILGTSDRIIVLKDGTKILDESARLLERDRLMSAMGATTAVPRTDALIAQTRATTTPAIVKDGGRSLDEVELVVYPGEVVGFGGLAGHGQSERLVSLFEERRRRGQRASPRGDTAFVAGDRQMDGVFAAWSVKRNLTASSLAMLAPRGLIGSDSERRIAEDWCGQLSVRCASIDAPILSLSGGNQQKILFARALATPASLVLMDDPTRGVDIATKHDIYRRIRHEALSGRTFIWYSTEFDELRLCDRVYIFHEGRIVGSVDSTDLTEDAVLQLAFRPKA
jgi:ribose transport system ATP-binding protein